MFGPRVRARFSIYDLFGPFSNGKTLQWTHFTQGTDLIRRGWSRVLHPQQVYICHVVTPESIVKNHRRHLLQIHNDLGNTRLKGLYKLIDRKITRWRGGRKSRVFVFDFWNDCCFVTDHTLTMLITPHILSHVKFFVKTRWSSGLNVLNLTQHVFRCFMFRWHAM